jgi:DNA-binding MarR family transcriptional regulator
VSDLPHADQPWANWVPHLLWEVSTRTALLSDAALAEVGLSSAGIGLLDQVGDEPGITIAEIARRLPKTQQAVSQNAARLEKLGLIERRLAGGRAIGLHLTPAGARAREQGAAAEATFDAGFRDALGAERYEQLRALLQETRAVVADLQAARAQG